MRCICWDCSLTRLAATRKRLSTSGEPSGMAPQIADLHAQFGKRYRALGRLDEALAWYQRSLELDPNIAETHNNLGNAFQQQGEFAEAAACYEVALRPQPNQPQQ